MNSILEGKKMNEKRKNDLSLCYTGHMISTVTSSPENIRHSSYATSLYITHTKLLVVNQPVA